MASVLPAAQDRGDRGAHAGELGVGVAARRPGRDVRCRSTPRARARASSGPCDSPVERRERRDGERGRDVAARVPAHAVGDDEEVRARVGRSPGCSTRTRPTSETRGVPAGAMVTWRSSLQLDDALPDSHAHSGGEGLDPGRRAARRCTCRSSSRGPPRTTGRPGGRSGRAGTTSSRRRARACSSARGRCRIDGRGERDRGPAQRARGHDEPGGAGRAGERGSSRRRGRRRSTAPGDRARRGTVPVLASCLRAVILVPYRSRRSTPIADEHEHPQQHEVAQPQQGERQLAHVGLVTIPRVCAGARRSRT